jgi:hypothetical protein
MKSWFSRVRTRLSFANVVSTLALFLALGGTSYAAAQLPFNSVGKGQIKSNAVGKSEIAANSVGTSELRNSGVAAADIKSGAVGPSEVRANAIDSDELADGGIGAADLSDAAKTAVADVKGVTFRVSANADGTGAAGNAKGVAKGGAGVYSVDLGTDVRACQRVASLTGTPAGFVTVDAGATANLITVNTFAVGGAATDRAWQLLVAC